MSSYARQNASEITSRDARYKVLNAVVRIVTSKSICRQSSNRNESTERYLKKYKKEKERKKKNLMSKVMAQSMQVCLGHSKMQKRSCASV